MKEIMATCPCYADDLDKIRDFRNRKKLEKLADALRVCVEFTDARGGLK